MSELKMSKMLTKKEAAAHLRCHERTIDRYRAMKLLRAVKVRGKVLFPQDQLEACLKKYLEN